MMGVLHPQIYRYKMGGFEVTNLLDGYVQGKGPHPTFGNNQPAEVVQEYAKSRGLSPTKFENPYTPVLVNTGKELVLFDAGNPKGRAPTSGKLPEVLTAAGYSREQVDVVVITHGHVDHIGGLMLDDKPAFPNARYVLGEVDFHAWKSGEGLPESRKANRELYLKLVPPLAEKATFLKPDGEVVPGIRAVNAYGHSPGMMAYHLESNGQRLLVWADVANHYIMSIEKPEWHVSIDDMKDAAIATRKRIFDMVATDKIPVTGYHMPFPAVGYLEKTGDSYRWVAAGYQLNL
jgi:glyoxylase-like metal-dependent hydrolase (beta-lactamase superfamily II)